jgi:AcrR family transcriptional regulator
MAEIQRARILAATAHVACEDGASNATVASVVACAGVSRRTFYELFVDMQDCLLATIDHAVADAREWALSAYEAAQGGWRAKLRAGLGALLVFFDEQPCIARLLLVEWLAAGPAALECRQRLLGELTRTVDGGRAAGRLADGGSVLTSEGVVGGAVALLQGRLLEQGAAARLTDLLNPLMSMIVLPYLGPAGARRELEHAMPLPPPARTAPALEVDLFKGAGMRLTYRTMLVLEVIEQHPGSSNRRIAQVAGVTDQGQISKLLGRLERLGLIENNQPESHLKGEPNAWTLTSTGAQVVHALRAQSPRPSTPGEHHDLQPASAPQNPSEIRSEQPGSRTARKQTRRGRR